MNGNLLASSAALLAAELPTIQRIVRLVERGKVIANPLIPSLINFSDLVLGCLLHRIARLAHKRWDIALNFVHTQIT